MKKKLLLIIAATMLLSLVVFSGCDDRSVALDDINIATMNVSPSELVVGDTVTCYVRAILQDDDGFAVTNTKVIFKSDLGSMNPASVFSDSSGVAKVKFDYSTIESVPENDVVIEAYVKDKDSGIMNSTNVTFGSPAVPEVNSLQFDEQPISLQVAGTGGPESADLNVTIYDYQGALITEPMEIAFWFDMTKTTADDAKINNEVAISEDTAQIVTSVDGVASVSISSGIKSGNATVVAKSVANGIEAVKGNIIVQAGAPETVEFVMPGHNTGEDMGAGTWKVQIAALINDTYGNPVGDGTAVFFQIEDDDEITYASLETQYCYVGNENAAGDTLAGTAFTFLNYDGTHTNDSFDISVQVGGVDFPPETITLPIQFPVLEVVPVPQHLDWNVQNDNTDKTTELNIVITDGQQNRINKQLIYATGTLGYPELQTEPEPDLPVIVDLGYELEDNDNSYKGVTYFVDGIGGRLTKPYSFYKIECPAPSQTGPGTTTANITVTIPGTNTNANANIILFRYVD